MVPKRLINEELLAWSIPYQTKLLSQSFGDHYQTTELVIVTSASLERGTICALVFQEKEEDRDRAGAYPSSEDG